MFGQDNFDYDDGELDFGDGANADDLQDQKIQDAFGGGLFGLPPPP